METTPSLASDLEHRLEISVWVSGFWRTFLTVRLSVLHVEQAVPKRLSTGGAHETGGVPRLPQGVHHFLQHTTRYFTPPKKKTSTTTNYGRNQNSETIRTIRKINGFIQHPRWRKINKIWIKANCRIIQLCCIYFWSTSGLHPEPHHFPITVHRSNVHFFTLRFQWAKAYCTISAPGWI